MSTVSMQLNDKNYKSSFHRKEHTVNKISLNCTLCACGPCVDVLLGNGTNCSDNKQAMMKEWSVKTRITALEHNIQVPKLHGAALHSTKLCFLHKKIYAN